MYIYFYKYGKILVLVVWIERIEGKITNTCLVKHLDSFMVVHKNDLAYMKRFYKFKSQIVCILYFVFILWHAYSHCLCCIKDLVSAHLCLYCGNNAW